MPQRKRTTSKGGKGGRISAIRLGGSVTLSTLADSTLIGASCSNPGTLTRNAYLVSGDLLWSKRNGTGGEGPVLAGLAHGDLSDAEIEEALEVQFTGPDDIIARERARRPVRQMVEFPQVSADEIVGQGVYQRYPLKFAVQEGKSIKLWAYNSSGGALTTGASVLVSGKVYVRWY